MKFEDIKNYYKTGCNFMRETGISYQSYCNWRNNGYIPILSQMKIEALTGGILKADISDTKEIPKDRVIIEKNENFVKLHELLKSDTLPEVEKLIVQCIFDLKTSRK
jgi:hypothetical protein